MQMCLSWLSSSESFDKQLLEYQDYLGLSESFRIFHVTFTFRYELYMDDTCNTTTVIDILDIYICMQRGNDA